MNLWIITIILIIIISLLITIIYLQIQNSLNKDKGQESIKELDRALVKQEDTLLDLTKDIQSFHDPLNKLRRYLSGGTLAGKFGEWSLESIMQDIFNPNQYIKNAEVIKGSGKRVEFVLKMPEGLLLPIDAKFPSGLYDTYLDAIDQTDERLIKKSIDDIKRHVVKDASDIQEKYVQSGVTVDLGIMYIPSESLMQLIDSIENKGCKSDILRYEILYQYGGIYVDTDFESIKPIPKELLKKSFVACMIHDYKPQIGRAHV